MAHAVSITEERFIFSGKEKTFTIILMVLGLILGGIGVYLQYSHGHDSSHHEVASGLSSGDEHSVAVGHHGSWTQRVWANLLLNSYFFLLIAVAATFFIAVNYLANAGWAATLKRIPEAIGNFMPFALVALWLVLFFGHEEIYHWAQEGITTVGSPNYDKILAGKSPFLNKGWLLGGSVIMVGIWILFHKLLRKNSLMEDVNGGLKFFDLSVKLSAAHTFIFAFTFSIMSWLVIMSIDAHWFSTIFSVYNFAVSFVSGLTVICFFTIYLKSQGYLKMVNDEHIHDLGKFMFAFSIFWAYIWVAQFLLIWYANIPEEVGYFQERLTPHFKPHFQWNIILNFAIPFLVLMMRDAKRSPIVLTLAGMSILIGKWNDLFLMIMPGTVGESATIGAMEVGFTLFFAGFFIFVVFHYLSKANLYAKNHPYLEESVHHEVGP